MTAAQRVISLRMKASNCAGLLGANSAPRLLSRSFTSGSAITRVTSALMRSTMALGVPGYAAVAWAGLLAPKGTPASATVGRSGTAGERFSELTASARNRPCLTWGSTDTIDANIMST